MAFVAPGGISISGGITEYLNNELPIEQILLQQAEKVYIVAEHQKFDRACMLPLCDFNNIDAIITDSQCPDELVSRYQKAGIRIRKAPPI